MEIQVSPACRAHDMKNQLICCPVLLCGTFPFIRLYNTRVAVMVLYTCVLYPAQENLAEEKPIRTLNCKKVVRGQCCLLTKREALLSFFPFIFSFIYLFIFIFHLPFILTNASIHILPVFPLYSIIFCSTCYVAISFCHSRMVA